MQKCSSNLTNNVINYTLWHLN